MNVKIVGGQTMLQTVFGGSRMDVLGKSFPDVRSSDGECSH